MIFIQLFMKLVLISDTHNKHKWIDNNEIPKGDVLIHAGDYSGRGSTEETKSFLDWYSNLPHKYKIFIAGNHDFFFERKNQNEINAILPSNVIYLNNSGITIEGINFWGSPNQPIFFDWAFNKTEEELIKTWNKIPTNTDVLITHSPPFGILDKTIRGKSVGCTALKKRVTIIKPKINVFGHIHESYGIIEQNGTTFINASLLNERYYKVNDPIVIDI